MTPTWYSLQHHSTPCPMLINKGATTDGTESSCAPGAHHRHQHAPPSVAQPAGRKGLPASCVSASSTLSSMRSVYHCSTKTLVAGFSGANSTLCGCPPSSIHPNTGMKCRPPFCNHFFFKGLLCKANTYIYAIYITAIATQCGRQPAGGARRAGVSPWRCGDNG